MVPEGSPAVGNELPEPPWALLGAMWAPGVLKIVLGGGPGLILVNARSRLFNFGVVGLGDLKTHPIYPATGLDVPTFPRGDPVLYANVVLRHPIGRSICLRGNYFWLVEWHFDEKIVFWNVLNTLEKIQNLENLENPEIWKIEKCETIKMSLFLQKFWLFLIYFCKILIVLNLFLLNFIFFAHF